MGIFDAFETVLDRVAGAAQGFVLSGGNPVGAFTGAVAVENRKKQEKQIERAEFMALQIWVHHSTLLQVRAVRSRHRAFLHQEALFPVVLAMSAICLAN
jgi:hypothetical protein